MMVFDSANDTRYLYFVNRCSSQFEIPFDLESIARVEIQFELKKYDPQGPKYH